MLWRGEFQPKHICSIEREDSRDRGQVSGPSSSNGGGGKSNGSTGGPGAYNGQGRPNTTPAKTAPASTAVNSREADDEMAAKYGLSPGTYTNAAGGLRDKILDGTDFGEGLANTFGKFALGFLGYSEVNPLDSPEALSQSWGDSIADAQGGITRPMDESADRQVDPIKAALTLSGPFTGMIGTGASALYGLNKYLGGPSPEIDLGPSGPATPDNLTAAQRQLAGLAPRGILTQNTAPAAPALRSNASSAPAIQPTRGILTQRPVANVAAASPVTATPAAPSAPATPAPNGYPTPTERYGAPGYAGNYIVDPLTGRLMKAA